MNAPAASGAEQVFARFLDLERLTRAARTPAQLAYSLVNDGQALFGFRHAALLIAGKVQAVTGVSAVDPNAPFVAFVEQAVAQLFKAGVLKQARVIPANVLSESIQADWQSLSAAQVFWLPLIDHQGEVFGGLWLARDLPWNPSEQVLLSQLGDTYSHAWLALQPRKPWRLRWTRKRRVALVAVLLLGLLIPVRQSVLAPAEVVPLGGRVVAAPLDGVIAEFLVKPNQTVKAGDLLLRFESTTLKAQADVAERALGVAEAELKANSQRSFADAESSSKIDLLAARVEQKRAERDYARELLKRSEVRAERGGIAVFADAERWTGKPVQTGERLMEIADPTQAELRIELAVGDAISLEPGAQVALFLDSDPLQRHLAKLERSAYEAQPTAAGQLAYRLDANFEGAPPRIGLRGTAKIFGDRAPLALYLLRRPLAGLRQSVGL
ncbi:MULTISPECIES: efflux RND transporter periplasmic adaptor subunit [Pseudomonas]|jgi:multidrug resistance efflux pump|uniref:HlyD family efflux transporter periplasmic adaptor subunit n=2 Tax=Pseudomonas fluorescens group TaxID=136843 RepID=A0AB36CXC5_9PSED|nr:MULTISPECIES: HlyD family efflux transporter periplasmic adaptor subunit [Pseudomonas]MBA4359571.1 HlyD family secretion protein [Pseudomonas sp.]MDO8402944.1 HlyD family efflux transporter periplasmic adaptor subunit [Pseudomonas sp.]MSU95295.1 HlyD family efflux transporter periplasmic adaptor subunit [Pseudomonas mandelii]NMZ80649.1 HlyD family efflux transporter periplasmic adaptor subunit [Pseudomonas mandelii]PMV82522.1 HlyD family secretion protein [Pseudomonas sp. GW101-1A09]